MPQGFLEIPDWFPFENSGGGIAVTDLDATDGRQDLLVLMVDSPAGQNRGLYRVGKDLNPNGSLDGGWGPWIEIPEWFSWDNQGSGLAAGDLDGDGRPEMVVFMIDNPEGQNAGFYRVGQDLDGDGNVTGDWCDWKQVPGWFAWENSGGSISLADLDGDGKLELVVFMIDNPGQVNAGFYRIGRGLDGEGNVTAGWSEWKQVPGWFPWENSAGGVAVADLEDSGLMDIVVFQIDNPIDRNQAYYKIGKNLNPDGTVEGGWGSWMGVPDWFSWENAGGDIEAVKVDGKHELAVMMVDNPPGKNEGFYRLLDLDHDPLTQGSWELLPYFSEVLAVHGAVLPTGKVLFFAGSGTSRNRFDSPDFGDLTKGIWTSVVWNPLEDPADPADNFTHPATLKDAHGKVLDFFCGGDAFLPDGTLLSAGGTLDYPRDGLHGFLGRADCCAFDPFTEKWSPRAKMNHGRWYPTLIPLADGHVLATSGLSEAGPLNPQLEVYDGAADQWEQLPIPPVHDFPGLPVYPHVFLLEDGRLVFTGGRTDDPSPVGPCLFDLTQNPVGITPVPGLAEPASRNQSASVLLPPAQDQRVMIIGGGPIDESNSTDSVAIADMKDEHPHFVQATPMNLPRLHLNAVLLPDHTVFVSGGGVAREFEPAPRLQAEIYDPETDTWRIAATASVGRLYHSIALLLPDGRVVAAGGNPEGGNQVAWVPPDPNEELRMEVFSPPYLFKGPRPVIAAAPDEWRYGSTVTIGTPQAGNLRWASLLKPCITTHGFDNGQRLVDLEIVSQGGGELRASVTDNPNLAPPGWYMLFLVDTEGVPSAAKFIHLS